MKNILYVLFNLTVIAGCQDNVKKQDVINITSYSCSDIEEKIDIMNACDVLLFYEDFNAFNCFSDYLYFIGDSTGHYPYPPSEDHLIK